jgi:hypothetical protein
VVRPGLASGSRMSRRRTDISRLNGKSWKRRQSPSGSPFSAWHVVGNHTLPSRSLRQTTRTTITSATPACRVDPFRRLARRLLLSQSRTTTTNLQVEVDCPGSAWECNRQSRAWAWARSLAVSGRIESGKKICGTAEAFAIASGPDASRRPFAAPAHFIQSANVTRSGDHHGSDVALACVREPLVT